MASSAVKPAAILSSISRAVASAATRRRSRLRYSVTGTRLLRTSWATCEAIWPRSARRFLRASSRFFTSSSSVSWRTSSRRASCVCSSRSVAACQAASTVCKSACSSSSMGSGAVDSSFICAPIVRKRSSCGMAGGAAAAYAPWAWPAACSPCNGGPPRRARRARVASQRLSWATISPSRASHSRTCSAQAARSAGVGQRRSSGSWARNGAKARSIRCTRPAAAASPPARRASR